MFSTIGKRKQLSNLATLGVLFLVCVFSMSSTALAQDDPPYIGEVRIFDPDFTMPHAEGLAFSPVANIFLMQASHSAVQLCGESDNLTIISPYEELIGYNSLPAISSPINITFDSKANRLLMFDTVEQELIVIDAGLSGFVNPAAISRFEADQFGLQNPQGMAVNPVNGALFILSETNAQIVRVMPDSQGSFDEEAALAEGRISQIDLGGLGLGTLRGLAINPTNGHLYLLNPVLRTLYEVSDTGQLVAARDMSVLDVGFRDPQGFVFAPSADLTDDPAQMHLYLMDSGLGALSNDALEGVQYPPPIALPYLEDGSSAGAYKGEYAEQGPGRIIEFTLTRPVEILR